jgi:hypothetical protein
MPAKRLTEQGSAIGRSDVVAFDTDGVPHFLRHTALAADGHHSVAAGDSVRVNHMGPPLERDGQCSVHVSGTAELNDDELNQIELFIDELHGEQRAQVQRRRTGGDRFPDYTVHPHADYSPDGSFRRFSCAGYVVEAYRDAGIDLIDIDAVPAIDLQMIYRAYPDLERVEANPPLRSRMGIRSHEDLGLAGDGPWPVLLPGYVLHSLARNTDAIREEPYSPNAGDECFPRRE